MRRLLPDVVLTLPIVPCALNQLVTLTTLFYMCATSYISLMRLRLFNYFYLVGGHHTDNNSLLFLGAYVRTHLANVRRTNRATD